MKSEPHQDPSGAGKGGFGGLASQDIIGGSSASLETLDSTLESVDLLNTTRLKQKRLFVQQKDVPAYIVGATALRWAVQGLAGRKLPAQLDDQDPLHPLQEALAINGLDRDSKSVGFHVTGFARKYEPDPGTLAGSVLRSMCLEGGVTTGCYRRLVFQDRFRERGDTWVGLQQLAGKLAGEMRCQVPRVPWAELRIRAGVWTNGLKVGEAAAGLRPDLPLPGGLKVVAEAKGRGVVRTRAVSERDDFRFVGVERYVPLRWMPTPWSVTLRAGFSVDKKKPTVQWFAHF